MIFVSSFKILSKIYSLFYIHTLCLKYKYMMKFELNVVYIMWMQVHFPCK